MTETKPSVEAGLSLTLTGQTCRCGHDRTFHEIAGSCCVALCNCKWFCEALMTLPSPVSNPRFFVAPPEPLEDWEVEVTIQVRTVLPFKARNERHAHYLACTTLKDAGIHVPLDQTIIKRRVQR